MQILQLLQTKGYPSDITTLPEAEVMFQGESFPLLTAKRVFWRGVLEELLWFLGREAFRLGEKCSVNIFVADFSKERFDATKKIILGRRCHNSNMMCLFCVFSCYHLMSAGFRD